MRTKRCLWVAAVTLVVVSTAVLLRGVNTKTGGVDAGCDNERAVSGYVGTRAPVSPQSPQGDPSQRGALFAVSPAQSAVNRPPILDRFVGAEIVASQTSPTSDPQVRRRKQLVRTLFKYPLVRVEETLSTDPKTGQDILVEQLAMVGDHVIVRLKEGRTRDDLAVEVAQHGFEIRDEILGSGCFLVSVTPADLDSVLTLIETFEASVCVDFSEPDYLIEVAESTPDDPSYYLQWGMNKIEMPKVWDMTTGTGGVVVAVFDTGIDFDHPDLKDNIWSNPLEIANNALDDDGNNYTDDVHGWDFYNRDNDPTDDNGHGTHVSGIIGAMGNNGTGVAGVGWNIRIMPIKIFNASGTLGYMSDVIDGVYYVITQRTRGVPVRVTNHSWGGGGFSSNLEIALRVAGGQGILHVAAAGNEGLDNDIFPHYPSGFSMSNMLAVANTTSADGLSSLSNYGVTSVDLGAPGSSIFSSIPSGNYGYKSGTSMASPHVVGVAALLFDYMPQLTWQQVRQALFDGTDPVASLTGRCVTEGRLNAYKAFATLTPTIEHVPLENTTDIFSDHIVEARIRPSVPFVDTNCVVMLWNTTGSTNTFTTNVMQHVSNDLFRTIIPSQNEGVAIHYMIRAETKTDLLAMHPASAPTELHRFDVTYPVPFSIIGLPDEYGTTTPEEYGDYEKPWGSAIVATASPYTVPTAGHRYRCDGWYGFGDVPAVGTSNSLSFVIRSASTVLWIWEGQYGLQQQASLSGVVDTVTWWDVGEVAETTTAPAIVDVEGTSYAFVNWIVDGVRYPNAFATALNPAVNLTMNAAKDATASYIPEAEDDDADGLPDWWELFNYSHLDSSPTNDPDGDGFSNAEELADRSDPLDAESVPEGPEIVHIPLDDPMGAISPWRVSATVTDRVGVGSVRLFWQINGEEGMAETNMTLVAGDVYEGSIFSAHLPGDIIEYHIEADDSASNRSESSAHTFQLVYPVVAVAPSLLTVSLKRDTLSEVTLTLTNQGNAELTWQLVTDLTDPITEFGYGWTHSGVNDQWHIATQQVHSARYAWYFGDDATDQYQNGSDAVLIMPPVTLGGTPTLSFWQWIEVEYEGRINLEDYYWDGGVVDISTNGGITFDRIVPVGGYPCKITPNYESPFSDPTPCFGGTGGWENVTFDLEAYAGRQVQIRFRFGSDLASVDRGWFIDDVQFRRGESWLQYPASSGTLASDSSGNVTVLFDTTGMPKGDYQDSLILTSNDPTQPILSIPVILHVYDKPSVSGISLAEGGGANTFVITWPSTTGMFYSLLLSPTLGSETNWSGIPGYTNLPGCEGFMSYTGVIDHVPTKFYRINAFQP